MRERLYASAILCVIVAIIGVMVQAWRWVVE